MQAEIKSLNYKKRLFCLNYVKNLGNSSRAALEAGYSPSCAKSVGSRLLKDTLIQGEIKNLMANSEKFGINEDFVLSKLKMHCDSDDANISLKAIKMAMDFLNMFNQESDEKSKTHDDWIISELAKNAININ